MISRETIDEVKSRIDILDVISDFVSVKRSGQNYKALSPFTNEKTASFYVVPSKGIFKDFSSGKGGDAITFVMEHEGMSYLEAIRYMAKKYGVEVKEEDVTAEQTAQQNDRDSLYILMNYAKEYFAEQLYNSDEGKSIGLSYFRERGYNDRTIERFELGYSINEWDSFNKMALSAGHSEDMLDKAGLIIKKEGGRFYDRFRGRVIFPIHNLAGKVIAFGARILTKQKDQPKYINSPETEIYHKSNVLYGMFQAKNGIRREDFCYLVEGYTDVISMHLADIDNVVSSSGTALTEEQIKLIRRFTENVTVLFDGDAAGIKAALRGIDLVLKGGLNVRIVLLPDSEDPDSFSRKTGSAEFKQYLKDHTQDFISFKIDLFAKDAARDPIKKAEAIRDIISSIALIPDPIKRSVYIQETGRLLKISESVLFTELNKHLIKDRRQRDQERTRIAHEIQDLIQESEAPYSYDPKRIVQLQERETVRLLLNYADKKLEDQILGALLLNELDDVDFTSPVYKEIFDSFVNAIEKNEHIDSSYFLEQGGSEVKKVVSDLVVRKYDTSPHWASKFHIYFPKDDEELEKKAISNVMHLKFRLIQLWVEANKELIKDAKSEFEVDELMEKQMVLKSADVELSRQLGIAAGKY